MDDVDIQYNPASRYRAGSGAVFSSSKCPSGPGLEHSCELPFGFMWTPLSPTDESACAVISCNSDDGGDKLPPVLCLTCLSYMNLYASFDEETGIWTCPLCGAKNVAPRELFLTSTSAKDEYSSTATASISPVLMQPLVEFRQNVVSPPKQRVDQSHIDTCSIILVMDENLPREEAKIIGTCFQRTLWKMKSRSRIDLGLIVFGKNISIYRLGIPGGKIASADVFPNHDGLSEDFINTRSYVKSIFAQSGDGGGSDTSGNDLDCLWSCLAAVYGVDSTQGDEENGGQVVPPLSRMEKLRQRKESRLRQQNGEPEIYLHRQQAKSPWTTLRETVASEHRHQYRCTGDAIQCAIDLATVDPVKPSRTGRILLFTNGCPNYGDGSCVVSSPIEENADTAAGRTKQKRHRPDMVDPIKLGRAVEYFGVIAKAASEVGVAMDVLCTGAHELALPSYQALVEPSSGYVLPHTKFTSEQLENNIDFLLRHTYVAGLHFDDRDDQAPLVDDNWVDGCIIDFRMPRYVLSCSYAEYIL